MPELNARQGKIADLEPAGTARARKAMEELLAGRYNQRRVTQIAAEFRDDGPLRAVEVLARSSEANGKQARYRFLFENENALVALHQDRDGRIERLGISLE